MTKKLEPTNSSIETLLAARSFSRRVLFKGALAAGAMAAAGPYIVRDAFSSSGELNLLNWDDEIPNPVIPNFEKKTGIKVKTTPFSQNEEQINKLQATGGEGFDLCQPTRDRAPQFQELDVLQPFDTSKLHLDQLLPSMLEGSTSVWTWDGKLYHVPHCWGSEAIAWRSDLATLNYKDLSYGTLWSEPFKGKMQGRPHSLLLGIGLWMDHTGKLPSNRMLDAFKDEASMKKIYDVILAYAIANKAQVKQFWDSSDNTKSGFMENGAVIGQTWDGPAISLWKQGKPVRYMAPQEGAITWIDGWAMPKGATNIAQAYEWLNYVHTPEVSAMVAEGSGYNAVVKGSDAFLSETAKKIFAEAYPEDALSKLWSRPPEPSWYAELRTQYAEKFKAA
ncbi:extracellular solute-binding protein [Ancylobacter amanitiformis]|uniref:Spermidine/putrescine transport system substrate-binding protein n=1 Tax=Ancylobacter amanitiformis TaxID=217069 RepID=A0ABU0LXC8_9HYPH|nr:extracellular solute-binding protein [Ancylobacter amanitiformis]MDQ0513255.1 spermidine/putrescine transport system substrate-binding protein [Ancylobacter amanitiformis]